MRLPWGFYDAVLATSGRQQRCALVVSRPDRLEPLFALQEGRYQHGVEMFPRFGADDFDGLLVGLGLFVTSPAGDRVVGVDQGDDPRRQRNAIARNPPRVPRPVEPFMVAIGDVDA